MDRNWNNALSGSVVGALLLATFVGPWLGHVVDQRNAALSHIIEQDREIAALKQDYADAQMQADSFASKLGNCLNALDARPAAPASSPQPQDSDFVTVIVSQVNIEEPSAAPNSSTLVALANMYHPGLGSIISSLTAGQSPPAAGSPETSTVRWIVAGRVTPYIAPGDSAVVGYAWINVKTNAIEQRQPDPAGALLARYQQGAR